MARKDDREGVMNTTCGVLSLRASVASVLPGVWSKCRGLATIVGCAAVLGCSPTTQAQVASSSATRSNIALYYQSDVPVDELRAFDLVVIDPGRANPPPSVDTPLTTWA